MRLALPVLLSLALAGPAFATGAASLDEAKQIAARESKPVLVDFFAVW